MTIGVHNVEELHNVGVAHLLQQRDLSDGGARNTLILGLQSYLLQGDDLSVVGKIASLVDDTIRAYEKRR